jgi:hypothetical protein
LRDKLPASLKLNGVNYTVKVADGEAMQSGAIQGEIIYHSSTIRLWDELSLDRAKQSLCHEIVHALIFEAGFRDKIVEKLGDEHELFVDMIGDQLYHLMKSNDLDFMRKD